MVTSLLYPRHKDTRNDVPSPEYIEDVTVESDYKEPQEQTLGNSIWKQKYSEAKYSGPKWMGLRDWGLDRTDRLIARIYCLSRLSLQ
ncbi:hypothetical protein M0804_002755 [Polistes exclamans]|nr:hypothetical protein M0804_002755 [Polistes exclamans]